MQQLFFIEPGKAEWREAPEPRIESDGDALVRPLAVAACDLDRGLMRGDIPFEGPFPLGHEVVAEVVEVGAEAAEGPSPGTRVVVPFQISCGECGFCRRGVTSACEAVPRNSMYGMGPVGGDWGGGLGDLLRVPFAEKMLVPLPDGLEPADVASAPDNIADGWRTVGPQLAKRPGAPVLVVGGGAPSIALYACQVALALGAERVDYVDASAERLETARAIGANAIEGPPPDRLGPYPITVDASADRAGLACALRSTEPGGACTSVGIYFEPETPVPLLEMYTKGIVFRTGRVDSLAALPAVLELIASGRLQPERVTSRVAPWDEAQEALADPPMKLVIAR